MKPRIPRAAACATLTFPSFGPGRTSDSSGLTLREPAMIPVSNGSAGKRFDHARRFDAEFEAGWPGHRSIKMTEHPSAHERIGHMTSAVRRAEHHDAADARERDVALRDGDAEQHAAERVRDEVQRAARRNRGDVAGDALGERADFRRTGAIGEIEGQIAVRGERSRHGAHGSRRAAEAMEEHDGLSGGW